MRFNSQAYDELFPRPKPTQTPIIPKEDLMVQPTKETTSENVLDESEVIEVQEVINNGDVGLDNSDIEQ